jgi:hypothetical protein
MRKCNDEVYQLAKDAKTNILQQNMWALDVRLSEWCCSVSMVWVQIPSREEQKFYNSKIIIQSQEIKYIIQTSRSK